MAQLKGALSADSTWRPIRLILTGHVAQSWAGPGRTDLGLATLVGITLTRLLFLPLMGLVWVRVVDWLGFLPPADPMFRFVLLLQFATPTAINLGTVCLPFCHFAILAFCHCLVSPLFIISSSCHFAIFLLFGC